jgi:hypothetical protein
MPIFNPNCFLVRVALLGDNETKYPREYQPEDIWVRAKRRPAPELARAVNRRGCERTTPRKIGPQSGSSLTSPHAQMKKPPTFVGFFQGRRRQLNSGPSFMERLRAGGGTPSAPSWARSLRTRHRPSLHSPRARTMRRNPRIRSPGRARRRQRALLAVSDGGVLTRCLDLAVLAEALVAVVRRCWDRRRWEAA